MTVSACPCASRTTCASLWLKRKSNANLRRQTVWHGNSARRNEVTRLPKSCQSHVGDKVVSEVRPVRQIEDLKDGLQGRSLPNLEVLRYACVQLEERLPSHVVKRHERALPRTQTVSELHPIGI